MTDLTPPDGVSETTDELVSAYLDGTATADERAAVERSASHRARLDQFQRIHDQLATPLPTAQPHVRESAIAAALATWDEQLATRAHRDADTSPAALTVPVDLERARRARARRRVRVASVAAIVLVVLALPAVIALSRRHEPSTTQTASAPTEGQITTTVAALTGPTQTSSSSAGAVASGAPPAVSAAPETTLAPATTTDLGSIATPVDLAAKVSLAMTQSSADGSSAATSTTSASPRGVDAPTASPSNDAADACEAVVRSATSGLGVVRFQASATYQGHGVTVLVFAGENGRLGLEVFALDAADCSTLAHVTL